MSRRIETYNRNASDNQRNNNFGVSELSSTEAIINSPVRRTLIAEGCESFNSYIEDLGLSKDQNPVVLSSLHHYYYDTEEMKKVNMVINLKELNHVKQLSNFLHSIFHNLRRNCYFIGCFIDNSKSSGYELRAYSSTSTINRQFDYIENGIISRNPFLNMLYSIMDQRTNKYMSDRHVSILLNDHGFKVLDMTEINGLTYFCAQRLKTADK